MTPAEVDWIARQKVVTTRPPRQAALTKSQNRPLRSKRP